MTEPQVIEKLNYFKEAFIKMKKELEEEKELNKKLTAELDSVSSKRNEFSSEVGNLVEEIENLLK